MFNNIWDKLVKLAKILCWAGIGVFAVTGIIVLISGYKINAYYHEELRRQTITLGWIILIAGPLLSWIESMFIYCLGYMAYCINSIDDKMTEVLRNGKGNKYGYERKEYQGNGESNERKGSTEHSKALEGGGWKCSCGRVNQSYVGTCACGQNKPK